MFITNRGRSDLSCLNDVSDVPSRTCRNTLIVIASATGRPEIDSGHCIGKRCLVGVSRRPGRSPCKSVYLIRARTDDDDRVVTGVSFSAKSGLPVGSTTTHLLCTNVMNSANEFLCPTAATVAVGVTSGLVRFSFSTSSVDRVVGAGSLGATGLSNFILRDLAVGSIKMTDVVLSRRVLKEFNTISDSATPIIPLPNAMRNILY